MGKFKMPTVQQFLKKKMIYDKPKKDPVWVFLEREMVENINNKPYNKKVGSWLKFLKELRYYFFCEGKKKERRLKREVGPQWYFELSTEQREVLNELKYSIHQDLLEDIPNRVCISLINLGVTLRIPHLMLMQAMNDSAEDPGIFIWNLYQAFYKQSPSELQPYYDMNAMILMSCLVFVDLDECIDRLEKLLHYTRPPKVEKKKRQKQNYQPDCRYGEYLQINYIPFYCNHSSGAKKKKKVDPIGYKFRLRTEESYERLCKDHNFLEKRKERNKKEQQQERICNYKFWEPPSTLRNTDPTMIAYVNKLKMLKLRPKAKFKTPYKNVQYVVGGVAFTGGKPNYILNTVSLLPTGYVPIHGGLVAFRSDYVTCIQGLWKFPKDIIEKCDKTCDCLAKWHSPVIEYLKKSKCKCAHLYDFYNEGKAKEKYFYQPTRHGPFWLDAAKVYQMDPTEDFIKDTVREAVKSPDLTPDPSHPTISATGLKEKELLAAFLADLSDTPLLIPHLPQSNLLNNLQEWVRKRIKGKLSPKEDKQFILQSARRWLDLSHMNFRASAYRIPFTLKQLEHMNWAHRSLVQKLFNTLLDNFQARNRLKQVEQTRLWWSTMKYDAYPSKAFLDIFFTYMPARMKDTYLINPYSSETTPKYGAKTCPL